MVLTTASGRALGGTCGGLVAEGQRVVRGSHQIAPLATNPDTGGEEAPLGTHAVLAIGCMKAHV